MNYRKIEVTDADWKEPRTPKYFKQEIPYTSQMKALSVPRFCEKWMKIFEPWLSRCIDDENKPFCKACQVRLDCNRNHLQRHERTSKHERNLKIFLEKGEEGAFENFQIRQERNKYYLKRKSMQSYSMDSVTNSDTMADGYFADVLVEDEASHEAIQTAMSQNNQHIDKPCSKPASYNKKDYPAISDSSKIIKRKSPPVTVTKKDRMKLFMQIQKDKNDLMKTFRDLMRSNDNLQTHSSSPPKEKNHVDLFFDSVSSTVKTLSPKLIAEAKMRVQQLICELELRELTEGSAIASSGNIVPGTILVSPGQSFVIQANENPQNEEITQQDYEAL